MMNKVMQRVPTGRRDLLANMLVRAGKALIALVVVMSGGMTRTLADSPAPPEPFQMVTGGESEYIFVMLTTKTPYSSSGRYHTDKTPYPSSGLYRNDGSVEPLWTVDWYAHGIDLSRDGRHMVRYGPWASSPKDLGVAFYVEGRLIKQYDIESLVSDLDALPRSVSHFTWRAETAFDDVGNLLRIKTKSGDLHVFDITTGNQIVSLRGKQNDISGQVTGLDGTKLSVEQLHVCWGGPIVIGHLVCNGLPEASRLHAVALPNVRSIERVRGDSEGVRFKFHLRVGDHVELHIRERRFFCGKNKDGRSTWLAFSDIARIVM